MAVSSSPPMIDDASLLLKARNGDNDAFGELVTLYQRRIWMVCASYLGPDEADAAAQDTFVKAYANLGSFDQRAAFSTWLTRIAINTCLDELRRRKRASMVVEHGEDEGKAVIDQLEDNAAGPEDQVMQRQALGALRRLEEQLPEQQRRIFRLRFYAELELEEIASSLGVHVGTVKTQLHRAVHRLRDELGALR